MGVNMINMKDKRENIAILRLFVLFLFIVWTVYNLFFTAFIDSEGLVNTLLRRIIKVGTWTTSSLILLKYVYKEKPLAYLKLTKDIKKGIKWGFAIGSLFMIYQLIYSFILGDIELNLNFGLDRWLGGIILVGFTEEIVFRGFLFQKIMEITSFWKANVITSLLFLLIHFPKWYIRGGFENIGIIGQIIFVFIFSILQGKIFNKTNSLWTCIIIHSLNNFIGFAVR